MTVTSEVYPVLEKVYPVYPVKKRLVKIRCTQMYQ